MGKKKNFRIIVIAQFFFLLLTLPLLTSGQSISKKLNLRDDRISHTVKTMNTPVFNLTCKLNDFIWQTMFMQWQSEEQVVDLLPISITVQEEMQYGKDMLEKMKNSSEYHFIDNGDKYTGLQDLLQILEKALPDDSQRKYEIHLVENEAINAFTIGGQIIVFSGMLDFCQTTSELALVIGHEIGHNENGDIKRILKRAKSAGQFADFALMVKQLSTIPWNQFNEIRCDQYGFWLCKAAGYDVCIAPDFWDRMAKENNENPDYLTSFFRTHPYSKERAICAHNYLSENLNCN